MALATIEIRTSVLPVINVTALDVPGPSSGDGGGFSIGDLIVKWLKPRIIVHTPLGTLADEAPAGDPGESSWPLLGYVLAFVLALGAAGLWAVLRKPK